MVCTSRLEGIGPRQAARYKGSTVAALLHACAADYPRLPNYVLDDQGRVRRHVAIFVDGELHPRDSVLSAPLGDDSEVYVMQALSGG